MYDILIKNGFIIDGKRTKRYKSDLAMSDGKIQAIKKNINPAGAKRVVDAEGKIVAPGFIDIHTHSDASFIVDNRSESKIYQGVTSEVVGQCGSTFYPSNINDLSNLRSYVKGKNIDTDYYASTSFTEFINKADTNDLKPANNWLTLIGHNALRTSVMGFEGRPATQDEIAKMKDLLEQEMKNGAWGLSLGLGYAPGIFSDINELVALGEVVAKYNGMIASHMRDQGNRIYQALDEMFEINRRTGAHVHIAHLKLSGVANWGKAEDLLAYIRNAQSYGVNVTCDIYPYEAASSGITNTLPKWTLAGGVEAAAKRFKTDERNKIIKELEEKYPDKEAGDRIYIVSTDGLYPEADDKTIGELAEELDISVAEAIEKVVVETNGHCRQISFAMDENDMLRFIKEIDISIGSDGSGLPLDSKLNQGKPHPRNFGTFPRFLRLNREHNMMPLEDAIYKMTGNSAKIMGIKDRGTLEIGQSADITIFDEEKISDKATYKNPFQKPVGIDCVIINGETVVLNGEQTKERPGKFLLNK
ncbi:MAG: N-acyl-D-amino-acid deacylase family protein [Clostridia bacterium]